MKNAALKLATRGLAVFPCKARDKIPLTQHGCKDATKNAEQIESWWKQWPQANLAIATGTPSGVWVLDIDGEAGEAALRDIERRMRPFPATVEAITGGGGRHLFFRLPDFDEAPTIKNSTGQLGKGLDVRGEGGYVIAPPSVHPSGRKYCWSVDSAREFADPPVWLIGLMQPQNVEHLDDRRSGAYWNRVFGGVGEGQRNASAASIAGQLLRNNISPRDTYQLLLGWNDRNSPPLPEREIERIVESIWNRERGRRYGNR
jgi:hypothetical protein